jgi:glutathione peroxidase-family protein
VIDGKGRPIKRFSPTTKPEKMEAVIEKTLKKYDHAATQL